MQHRTLGPTELRVPAVVFGAWAIGGWNWGGSDDDAAVRAIGKALDLGMNAIDTAPVYGFGRSERVIGRAIAGRRSEVVLMTKVGLRWDDDSGEFYFQATGENGETLRVHRNLKPASVRHEVEASLARLGTDYLDLVQIHWPDPFTPLAETLGALLELRARGVVRAIGVSNFPVAMLETAIDELGDVPLASTQPKYSLVAREIEHDVLPFCRKHGVGVVVYSPLEQGLLTGKVTAERTFADDDGRAKRWTFDAENRAKVNDVLARVVRPIAERRGGTVAQVVIAWTVAQPGVTSAIVGARTETQVVENATGGEMRLTELELSTIRAAFEALALDATRRGSMLSRIVRKLVE
jgi:aryl-alcohol dehydrogenase-like predicted oxidoreductase